MANINIVKDNNMPSTDKIWVRTTQGGQVLGTYQFINGAWRKINGNVTGDGSTIVTVNEDGVVYATDADGNQTTIPYSQMAEGVTVVIRNEKSEIISSTPDEDSSDQAVVTLEMLKWYNA